jgi:hypothetical protein
MSEMIRSQTETKAKKDHVCNFCGFKIVSSEIYIKSTHVGDGEVYDWKSHKHCYYLCDRLKMHDNDDGEGITSSMFQETVDSAYDDIMIDIVRTFPKYEMEKQNIIIEQLKRVRWRDKLGHVLRHYLKIDKTLNPNL